MTFSIDYPGDCNNRPLENLFGKILRRTRVQFCFLDSQFISCEQGVVRAVRKLQQQKKQQQQQQQNETKQHETKTNKQTNKQKQINKKQKTNEQKTRTRNEEKIITNLGNAFLLPYWG